MRKSVQQVREDFDQVARIAERHHASDDGPLQPHERYLLRFLPRPCEAILELGCGTGEFSRRLAALATRVLAIDISPEMIRVARSRSSHCSNIEFLVADMTKLPLTPAAFDCVVSLNTLHHVDPAAALRTMRGALRPGGTILVADVLERAGIRNMPINALAAVVRFLRGLTSERRTQRGALYAAYKAHGCGESHPTLSRARQMVLAELPGAAVRGHLLWRYTVVWGGDGNQAGAA